eukprot:CAMPEP_0119303652 /NCGR_PEP_ID=MMETSP1333-20130426/5047_1 /TAXON_ID=418940 /ORGANISM="Scyphosphaera apsteinii, Strain RCC1455" /LENGTH=436 /DNA_ID=CAMNT_0007306385 /DNA_START=53 /DNA_END=1363 /DNA_ORIENTATION=-
MGRDRGWVSVSVQTYQSHRSSSQRVVQQDYTVDESGATLNALARNSDPREEERLQQQQQQQQPNSPTTSIFIRDWKLSGRRAYIRYDRDDNNFWFNPVLDEHKSSSTPGFPCSRGDIFLKLGMRGARLIPWRLQEGDVFRLGQAYVLVSKIRQELDAEAEIASAFTSLNGEKCEDCEYLEADTDIDDDAGSDSRRPQCYICYENGIQGNPLINLCQCAGSVKYVHLNCLQRWIQPEGSSAVNTHCPICKARYPEKAQAMMIRPPAILLESWSNHRSLKLRHWVSFARHGTASLGRFAEQNDVVIPDHSVSGEHAFIIQQQDQFWLHDRESSNGSFIRLCSPLKLTFGESLQMKMGKSLLCLQAKRSRWSRLRMRLIAAMVSSQNNLRFGERADEESILSNRSPRGSYSSEAEPSVSGGQGSPQRSRAWTVSADDPQ